MITPEQIVKGARVVTRDVSQMLRRELDFVRVRPTASTLFLTYRCNSRCKTCSAWKRDQQQEIKREIGFPEWKRIIDLLDDTGAKTTEIFGGNVLLRKELLISVLRYLREKNFCTHLPTNQIGLDDETAEVVASCTEAVYISTDGVGDHQDAIRGQKGASERVENAIAKLLRYRTELSKPRLVCNTTVSKYNVQDMAHLVQYAENTGFDEIHFEYAGEFTVEQVGRSKIGNITPAPYYLKQDESILVDREGARQLKHNLQTIKTKYANSGIKIESLNIDVLSEEDLVNGTIPHGKCYVERNEVTVDPAGDVVVCPFINNYSYGNLLRDDFDRIWNNHLHKMFRSYQNSGHLEMCRHCILGAQRNPGVLASLKRIYLSRIKPRLQ